MLARSCRGLSLRPVARGPRYIPITKLKAYSTSNPADQYHPKVSVLPFTNDVVSIQQKLDLLVPPMFGVGAAIKGYAQMIFGSDVVSSGIKRTNFKPIYIPTWTVDCVTTFTSILDDSEHSTMMQLRDVIVPGVNHHPLARWVKHFPDDIENAKPFSKDHLEPLDNKYDTLALPFTTSPLAISEVFNEVPYGDIVIEEGRDWAVDPHSVKFQMLAAYPLLHPAFLAEYTLEDKHITVLAHGYHDYFSVWGHTSHPDEWVNSEQGATVTYLTVTKPIIGGPLAMPDALTRANTEDNLDLIAKQADMNDLRIQPLSSAKQTRSWMALAGRVSQLKFLMESIPADAHIIKIGMTSDREDDSSDGARAPLKKQLKALEAEAEAAKPEWLKQWEAENSKQ